MDDLKNRVIAKKKKKKKQYTFECIESSETKYTNFDVSFE